MPASKAFANFALACLLLLAAYVIATTLRSGHDDHFVWIYADWITNYAGGFVRRGLTGELIGAVHEAAGVSRYHINLASNLALYGSVGTCIAFKYWAAGTTRILFLFVPTSLAYVATTPAVVGRKDILLFLLAFTVALIATAETARR